MWGGVCLLISPPIPPRSGLRQTVFCVDTELTHMPPHGRPPARIECVALRRPLEIFSGMMEGSGTNAVPAGKKNKVPSEVKKHTASLSCSVVKLVYSISLANIPKTATATADPLCRWRQNNVNNRGNKKETAFSFMVLSCVDLMFLSPCVYVCLSVCVFMPVPQRKNETAYEKKRKPGSSSCAC